MNFIYVTGNSHKSRLFNEMVGLKLEHQNVDVDEIQSLNLREVVKQKAISAFEAINKPVIVEDTQLIFTSLGRLPGSLIKWFLEELGVDGLCRLLDGRDRSAIAGAAIALYDGKQLKIFEKELHGSISENPIGASRFGWNTIFIPEGAEKTLGQMDELEFKKYYLRIKPFKELRLYLDSLEA